jgi:hypothetical protein
MLRTRILARSARSSTTPTFKLYNIIEEQNRFKIGEEVSALWTAPERLSPPCDRSFIAGDI